MCTTAHLHWLPVCDIGVETRENLTQQRTHAKHAGHHLQSLTHVWPRGGLTRRAAAPPRTSRLARCACGKGTAAPHHFFGNDTTAMAVRVVCPTKHGYTRRGYGRGRGRMVIHAKWTTGRENVADRLTAYRSQELQSVRRAHCKCRTTDKVPRCHHAVPGMNLGQVLSRTTTRKCWDSDRRPS